MVKVEHARVSFQSEIQIPTAAHCMGIGAHWYDLVLAVGKSEDGCVNTMPIPAPNELVSVSVIHGCGR